MIHSLFCVLSYVQSTEDENLEWNLVLCPDDPMLVMSLVVSRFCPEPRFREWNLVLSPVSFATMCSPNHVPVELWPLFSSAKCCPDKRNHRSIQARFTCIGLYLWLRSFTTNFLRFWSHLAWSAIRRTQSSAMTLVKRNAKPRRCWQECALLLATCISDLHWQAHSSTHIRIQCNETFYTMAAAIFFYFCTGTLTAAHASSLIAMANEIFPRWNACGYISTWSSHNSSDPIGESWLSFMSET